MVLHHPQVSRLNLSRRVHLNSLQGCIKFPIPPPGGGNRIKLLGKKIKWGRRKWKGKKGKGREEGKGKKKGKGREGGKGRMEGERKGRGSNEGKSEREGKK